MATESNEKNGKSRFVVRNYGSAMHQNNEEAG